MVVAMLQDKESEVVRASTINYGSASVRAHEVIRPTNWTKYDLRRGFVFSDPTFNSCFSLTFGCWRLRA